MKFSELDDFVNNQMNLQGEDKNFQQVVKPDIQMKY